MSTTEERPLQEDIVRPTIAQPTGYRICDRMESRLIGYLVRYVEAKEEAEGRECSSVSPETFMMMAYGVAVARQIYAEEHEASHEMFVAIANKEPRQYVGDIAWAIKMLSKRMRGKLITYNSGTLEGRRAQQVILEGGNP